MIVIRTTPVLGSQLRRHRKLRKLTQAELGKRVGIRQATISSLESGEGGNLETLFAVLSALGIDLAIHERAANTVDLGEIF